MTSILLVDDDIQIRQLFRFALEKAGYEVQDAPDGQAALQQFAARPTDLVITDIVMPFKDGLETIVELRKQFPKTRIISISGGGQLNPLTYLLKAKQLGADIALAKPVAVETLLQTVELLLGKNILEREAPATPANLPRVHRPEHPRGEGIGL